MQSPAFVLVSIGLIGFLVDLLAKPISPAGLALLLLAATPSLVAIIRGQAFGTNTAATTTSRAAAPARTAATAGPVPDRASPPPAEPRGAPGERAALVSRAAPEARPAPARAEEARITQAPHPHAQRPRQEPQRPAPAQAQRRAEGEPARPRAEGPAIQGRRPVESPRNPSLL